MLTIIGKQISDHEDTVILNVAHQFGQNKLCLGDSDLDELKKVVAQNVKQINKHKFKYCARIREYMNHTYTIVHKRPLPDHMRIENQGDKKKNKSDQLNFESDDTKMRDQNQKSWTPNPTHKKGHKGGSFGNGYGSGGGYPNSNRWNKHSARGRYSKGQMLQR